MTPRLLILAPFALLACASPPPPPPAAPPAPPPAAASPPPAAAPAEPAASPVAKVLEVVPGKEDVPSVKAKILFSNPSASACRVSGYRLVWGSQSKTVTLRDLTLPPGETRERWLRVNAGDGDLASLSPESGRIELTLECAR